MSFVATVNKAVTFHYIFPHTDRQRSQNGAETWMYDVDIICIHNRFDIFNTEHKYTTLWGNEDVWELLQSL